MPFSIKPGLTSWLLVTAFFAALSYVLLADAEMRNSDTLLGGLAGLVVTGWFLFLKPLVLTFDRHEIILNWYGIKKQLPYEAITILTLVPVRVNFWSVFRFVNRFPYKLLFLLTAMPFLVGFVALSMKSGLQAAWPLLLFMAALWVVLLILYVLAKRKILDFTIKASYLAMYIDSRYLDRFPFSYYRGRGVTYNVAPFPAFKKSELKKLVEAVTSKSPKTKVSEDLIQYTDKTPEPR